MGCASNEVDRNQNCRRTACKTIGAKSDRPAMLVEFEDFGDEIRQELDPSGPLERLLADHVIHAAWRLKSSMERQGSGQNQAAVSSEPIKPRTRIRPTAIETAAKAVREAFEAFEACRALKEPRISRMVFVDSSSEPVIEPNEWPIVPSMNHEVEPILDEEEIAHWRDRLTFDFEVSDVSPVVKGTWVTVAHVVSLIVDGWTWADILRSHPELSEDDIRACVTYAMDEENASR